MTKLTSLQPGEYYTFCADKYPTSTSGHLQVNHNQLFRPIKKTSTGPWSYEGVFITGSSVAMRHQDFCATWFDPLPNNIKIDEGSYEFTIAPANLVQIQLIKSLITTRPKFYSVTTKNWLLSLQDYHCLMTALLSAPIAPATTALMPCDCPIKIVMSVGCTNKLHF